MRPLAPPMDSLPQFVLNPARVSTCSLKSRMDLLSGVENSTLRSKPSPSPEPKFRFGFSGPAKRNREDRTSVDDILDSLSRRAELGDRFDEAAGIAFEDEVEGSRVPPGVSDLVSRDARKRALGKFAFVFLMVAGVFAVWLYGALNGVLDGTALGRITQSPVYSSAFTDPVKLAILAMCCFIPVIWLRKRRRVRDRLLYG